MEWRNTSLIKITARMSRWWESMCEVRMCVEKDGQHGSWDWKLGGRKSTFFDEGGDDDWGSSFLCCFVRVAVCGDGWWMRWMDETRDVWRRKGSGRWSE